MLDRRSSRLIWRLTAAGAQELTHPAVLGENATRRDLLRRIDGIVSTPALLASVAAAHVDDLHALAVLGLIAASNASPPPRREDPRPATTASVQQAGVLPAPAPASPSMPPLERGWQVPPPADPGMLTGALRQLVAAELGIRGFSIALALEKASNGDELRVVAQRALEQIRARRGEPAAAAARQSLFGA